MNKKIIFILSGLLVVIILAIFFYQKPINLTTIEDINEASQKAKTGDKRAIKFLIRNLENANTDIQKEAYNSITKIGKPAVPLLLKLLENKDPALQDYGAGLLGGIKDKETVPVLIKNLFSPDFKHKYVLCWALGEISDTSAIIPLISLYPKEKEDTQKYILRSIVKIGKPAIPFLLNNLESNDLNLQKLSILSLGQIRGKDLVPPLLKIVNEKNIEYVVLALGDLADPEGIDFLVKSLKHPVWQVRQKSAQSLTRFTDTRILPPLRAALNDEVVAVREWAAKAIECISEEKCKYKNGKGELVFPDSLYR
ncbi:MAG: HEAT repeat domain-containing protein [bacterium]|nr:HEAT repeat domain-containing protein [bacterium]